MRVRGADADGGTDGNGGAGGGDLGGRKDPSSPAAAIRSTYAPSLAISGGGGVIFLIVSSPVGMNWARTRRTLKTVVAAVEGLDTAAAGKVKKRGPPWGLEGRSGGLSTWRSKENRNKA